MILEYCAKYDSPTGPILLCSDGEFLTGLYLGRSCPADWISLPVFERTRCWLDAYFRGEELPREIPVKLTGTPFQKLIWERLLTIPFGETKTYGELAQEAAAILGKEKMSARAVGQAVGHNPISILYPCHRCVGAGGKLTGYSGGMENKIRLLRHEGLQIENDKVR